MFLLPVLLSAVSLLSQTEANEDFSFYQSRGPYEIGTYTIDDRKTQIWYPGNPSEAVHCYVFCVGTGAHPIDYAETAEHLASHGFAALMVPMRPWDVTNGLEYCRNGTTILEDVPVLAGFLDSTKLSVGGHSGGGPYAVHAASGVQDVNAIVAQHAASIPVLNRQSDKDMAALNGDLLMLCGTDDHMPFCGCGPGERDYYDRAPLGRVMAKVPDGHVDGACFAKGETNEAGYVTAMLYNSLRGDKDASVALAQGKEGDEVTVDL